MIPMFIMWPSGSLLVIRSPWNTNVLFGGVAWAFLIVGGVMAVRWLSDGIYQPIFTFYVPGLLLTLVTQVQWTVYRQRMVDENGLIEPKASGPEERALPRPSARRRRRNTRTRS